MRRSSGASSSHEPPGLYFRHGASSCAILPPTASPGFSESVLTALGTGAAVRAAPTGPSLPCSASTAPGPISVPAPDAATSAVAYRIVLVRSRM
ncbi:hypothetical protein NDU88_008166 [Pleurodeles waltl]|uniref:Uncharacterized protein n=1 Tax=Pleurodeles waltl TaxID=8319 RepID=A0AAV7RRI6_PLEWA|nr:hypothetical protein NDU88_008166 [Pleurodeles waltl]